MLNTEANSRKYKKNNLLLPSFYVKEVKIERCD